MDPTYDYTAYQHGWLAFEQGLDPTDNPYQGEDSLDWYLGWWAAREDAINQYFADSAQYYNDF